MKSNTPWNEEQAFDVEQACVGGTVNPNASPITVRPTLPRCPGCGCGNPTGYSYCSIRCRDEATELERENREFLAKLFPCPPGRPTGLTVLSRDKEDPDRLCAHSCISNTWQNPVNVAYRKRALYRHFRELFQALLDDGGALYAGEIPLEAEAEAEAEGSARRELANLSARLGRLDGHFRWFTVAGPAGGFVLRLVADQPDRLLSPLAWERADEWLIATLQALDKPGTAYQWSRASGGSPEWAPTDNRSGRWLAIAVRDLAARYDPPGLQDIADAEVAAALGIATSEASEGELLRTAPETVSHKRYFDLPSDPWAAPQTELGRCELVSELAERTGYRILGSYELWKDRIAFDAGFGDWWGYAKASRRRAAAGGERAGP